MNKKCIICKIENSVRWWKCCQRHTTDQGLDVVCQDCANNCLAGIEMINKPKINLTPIKITNCSLDTIPLYHCVVCDKRVHRGDSGCICSTFRTKDFMFSSLCVKCATVYDRLMEDEEIKPILKHLLNKEFWKGSGPVVDF